MNLKQVQSLVDEPIGCGRCAETPVFMSVLDTGEYFSLYAACPKCHFSCGMKVEKSAPPSVVMKAIQTVRKCFRRIEE